MNAPSIDLRDLAIDAGGHILLKHALQNVKPGERLAVRGRNAALVTQLRAWCRTSGHSFELAPAATEESAAGGALAYVTRGPHAFDRRAGADIAGANDPKQPGSVVDRPPAKWGLAARGATVEAGGPAFDFAFADKDQVWADEAATIYAEAAAAQWDPETAVDWAAPFEIPDEVEDAVVQVMTFLVENETAALIIPARFLAQIHPHFREVLQVLAIQAADEARHIEAFTRRATLRRPNPGLSTVGGQESLKTLLDEPDFALASFLLSVLGEGSFLSLLSFLAEHAPDPVTRQVTMLAARDEARHVAFGLAHLKRHASIDPTLRVRMANAVEQRHEALRNTDGLNEEVLDALVLLAAGSWDVAAIARGYEKVVELTKAMDAGRRHRLLRLGFSEQDAAMLSGLHTKNFM